MTDVHAQSTVLPNGCQYVPMIYRASDATSDNLYLAQQAGSGVVLGFNEPNEAAQADNTVAVSLGLGAPSFPVGSGDSVSASVCTLVLQMGQSTAESPR
jgi:hypothetical protein